MKNKQPVEVQKIEFFPARMSRNDAVCHRHVFHEFFYCAAGTGEQIIDDKACPMTAGDLFFFEGGQAHIGNGPLRGECFGYVLYVHDALFAPSNPADREALRILQGARRQARKRGCRLPLSAKASRRVGDVFKAMASEVEGGNSAYLCAMKNLFVSLLLLLLREAGIGEEADGLSRLTNVEQLRRVVDYLEINFASPIDIERLREIANMSRSHFHALFSREFGVSPVTYLNRLRVAAAMRMLDDGAPTRRVAAECGFGSLSNFYRVYKAQVGAAPRSVERAAS